MKKRAKQAELAKIAQSEAPIALYQSKSKQIKAIAVSKGLCELYGLPAAEFLNSCWNRTCLRVCILTTSQAYRPT